MNTTTPAKTRYFCRVISFKISLSDEIIHITNPKLYVKCHEILDIDPMFYGKIYLFTFIIGSDKLKYNHWPKSFLGLITFRTIQVRNKHLQVPQWLLKIGGKQKIQLAVILNS